jgi:hypothetical protein
MPLKLKERKEFLEKKRNKQFVIPGFAKGIPLGDPESILILKEPELRSG